MPNALPYTDFELQAVIHDDRYDVPYTEEQAKELAAEIEQEFKKWLFQRFGLRMKGKFEDTEEGVVRVPELSVKVKAQGYS